MEYGTQVCSRSHLAHGGFEASLNSEKPFSFSFLISYLLIYCVYAWVHLHGCMSGVGTYHGMYVEVTVFPIYHVKLRNPTQMLGLVRVSLSTELSHQPVYSRSPPISLLIFYVCLLLVCLQAWELKKPEEGVRFP